MTIIQLRCFLKSAETGSFTGAAEKLYLSVQVVSQHISNLETEIGAPLFYRNRDGVTLSEIGRRFYPYVIKWKGLYKQTILDIRELYQTMGNFLKIGVSEYIDITGRISGGLLDFKEKHPAISIEGQQMSNRILLQKVNEGELDIAIMCDTQVVSGGDFETVPFAKEDLRLYISGIPDMEKGRILDKNDISSFTDSLPHIDASYGIWNSRDWEEISRRMTVFLGFTVKERYVMPNFRSVIACIQTRPCTIVCDARFGYLRDSDRLYSIPLGIDSHVCCVWNKRNENPSIRLFTDFMKWYYEE